MRKNLLFGLFATMVLLLTTACQKENDLLGNGEATISFEISTPQMATRAFSDGNTATELWYAVYHEEQGVMKQVREEKSAQLTNKKARVEVQLATGKSYYVLFWAQADNAPYTLDFTKLKMNVVYADAATNYKALCNDESRDAFYWFREVEVNGAATVGVTLTRPFAQLNIGTNDFDKLDGVKADMTSVSVQGVYNTLNLVTGKVEGDAITANFALNDRPNKGLTDSNDENWETFPVAGYDYLAMNYLLVGDQKVVDVEFSYGVDNDVQIRTFTNIPVKANHRTNIYGALLTNNIGFDVEIEEDFDEPDENLYYVSVDGVRYTDFAEAVTKALELNKPIDFITDVKIDADNTITVPEGQTLTLNLNGQTLYGETDDADKNDDNKITSADNEVMFDVRGTMNVNGGTVGIKHVGESYENFGWNACGEVFYVGFNGELNVENATIENYGGVPMAYAIDMVNASVTRAAEAGIYVNVDNSTIKSSYIPVRVFNNGAGMNNVTIENTTLEGKSRAFWVHIYTQADDSKFFNDGKDTNGNGYKDETLNINIYNPTCHNTFIADNEERIIEYGFTNEINFREDGSQIIVVSSAAALTEALGKGVSVILDTDIDLGSTQLAITGENQVVYLGGHALTTANNWGGISLKNGATIKNGTITHAGNTAAIKAFNGSSVENVTINATCSTADKTVTGIAVQQGANVESIKNVTINGVSQGIEVGYQATVGLIENAVVNESNNGTAKGIGLVINGGKVGKAKNCTFKGETYGVTLHLKGVFAAGLDLENCEVEGTTASIYAWDEKGISNTSGSLVLTYDAATILTGPFVWDFEDECKSVVTLNKPE